VRLETLATDHIGAGTHDLPACSIVPPPILADTPITTDYGGCAMHTHTHTPQQLSAGACNGKLNYKQLQTFRTALPGAKGLALSMLSTVEVSWAHPVPTRHVSSGSAHVETGRQLTVLLHTRFR
jgi:hypothetical protein